MVVLCYRVLGFTELQDTIPVVVFHEEEEGERGLAGGSSRSQVGTINNNALT
jgi:hypothetical protein